MTIRKKKILLLQILLILAAIFVIFNTYVNLGKKSSSEIVSEKVKQEINQKIKNDQNSDNVFYDIVYSGLDLSGNRYVIEAKEASNNNDGDEDGFVNLKTVKAIFYLKNNKNLLISSNYGVYNNKSLDMKFSDNVKAEYDKSNLFAEKAEYFNSKNFIEISDNVKINDQRGTIVAEKLLFDLEKNKLDITSTKNDTIKANVNYK